MGASCYVTIMIEDNRQKKYYGAFLCDDVGFLQRGIANDPDFSLKKCLQSADGKALLEEIDNAYGGLFSEFEEVALFQEAEGTRYKANHLQNYLEIDGEIGGQSIVEVMPTDQMVMIKIWENVTDDELGSAAILELDFSNHTVHTLIKRFYDEGTQITETITNLDNEKQEILRDGFFEEDEEEYDDE